MFPQRTLHPNYDSHSNSKGADLALLDMNNNIDLAYHIKRHSIVIEPILSTIGKKFPDQKEWKGLY